jgi:hypothetical protein
LECYTQTSPRVPPDCAEIMECSTLLGFVIATPKSRHHVLVQNVAKAKRLTILGFCYANKMAEVLREKFP